MRPMICLVLLLGLMPIRFVSGGENLVPNGDFEARPLLWNWEQWADKIEPGHVEETRAFSGQSCYLLTLPGELSGRFINSQSIPVVAGQTYQFKIALRCENLPEKAALVRILQRGTKKSDQPQPQGWVCLPPRSEGNNLIATGGTHDWREYVLDIPVESLDPTTTDLSIYVYHQAVGIGSLGVDGVSFTPMGSPRPVVVIPAAPKKLAAALVELTHPSPDNRWPGDTSFETGLAGWSGGELDSASAAHGQSALRWTEGKNLNGPKIYGLIQKGRHYTISFYARAEPAGEVAVEVWHLNYSTMAGRKLKLTEQWQRFDLGLPSQENDQSFYLSLSRKVSAQVWVDAVQFQEGPLTDYRPAEPLSLGLDALPEPGGIWLTGLEPVVLTARIFNAGGAEISGASQFRLQFSTLDNDGLEAAAGERELDLAAGAVREERLEILPTRRPGYYVAAVALLDAAGREVKRIERPLGVVDPPAVAGADPESFFGLHPSGIPLEALQRIGVKWLREFRHWRWSAPEPEHYNDNVPSAEAYAHLHQAGFNLMETVQIMETPPWAKTEDGKLKNVADYLAFFDKLAGNAGDNVQYWEIQNEPDLSFPQQTGLSLPAAGEYYADLVAAVGAHVRQHWPKALLMAADGTHADYNANFAFSRPCLAKAGEQIAVVATHVTYAAARYLGPTGTAIGPEANNQRGRLLHLRDFLTAQGGRQRLWIGEQGWALDVAAPFLSTYALNHARYMVRSFLLARSVPEMERIMWFKAQGCLERKRYEYGLWRNPQTPLPATVAYAALARVLDHAQPVDVLFETDLQAFSYRRADGIPLVAFWKHQGEIKELTLKFAGEVRLVDMFGRERAPVRQGDRVVLPVSESPIYALGAPAESEGFFAAFRAAEVAIEPVMISVTFSEMDALSGFVKNNLPRPQTGQLRAEAPAGLRVEPAELPLTLAPSQTLNFRFALTGDHSGGADSNLRLVCQTDAGRAEKVLLLAQETCPRWTPAKGQEDPAEWKGRLPIKLEERGDILPPDPNIGWDGPADLSAEAGLAWDQEYFYFAARVRDDIHVPAAQVNRGWEFDSIQLAFDTLNDAREKRMEYDGNDREFTLCLSSAGPVAVRQAGVKGRATGEVVKGIRCRIVRGEGETRYFAAIPWDELAPLTPLNGRIFGFNFIVNDNDGGGRGYWLGLTPGIGEMKYPYCFKKFVLTQK